MLRNYALIALRTLRKRKGYTLINVLGLAVGMACCLLIGLYVRHELSYDRHHEHAGAIYRLTLSGHTKTGPFRSAATPPGWAPLLNDELPGIRSVVRLKPPLQTWLVRHEDKKFLENGFVFADSTVFDVFTFPLVQGNPRTALAAPFTVVISTSAAAKYFGDEDPMGQTLLLDNQYEFTITGIMADPPPTSHFQADLLASMTSLNEPIYTPNFLDVMTLPALYTYVLATDDLAPDAWEAAFSAFKEKHLAEQLAARGVDLILVAQPLTDIHLHSHLPSEIQANGDVTTIYVVSAIALLILLIACINFINLATARSANRANEVGMRKVLGAQRLQLIGQFLGESTLMALLAMGLALLLAELALPLLETLTGRTLAPSLLQDPVLLSMLAVLILFVGLLGGSYPAFFLSSFRPVAVLKGHARRYGRGGTLRKGLVVFQFAISILLIVSTTVVYNQLAFARNKKLGFDKERVVVVPMADRFVQSHYERLRRRIEQRASVQSVTASSSSPGRRISSERVVPENRSQEEGVFLQSFSVDYDFVETLGLEIVAGRPFSRSFPTDTLAAFLLNETAVSTLGWSSPQEALGKELRVSSNNVISNKTGRVVGVVEDFHTQSLRQPIAPTLITMRNQQSYFHLLVRLRRGTMPEAIEALETAWHEVFPDHVFQFSFLDQDFDRLYATESRLGTIFGTFSMLAIVVACLGLFGLAAFTAERRTKEIGIRKVLGASAPGLVLLLSKEFVKLVGVAFVVSAPVAYFAMNQWLRDFAYRIDLSWRIFLLAGLLALGVALLTVSYQAVKAALADPVKSLRYE